METRIQEETVVVAVRRPETFDKLSPNTKLVHINGFPFLWLIKQILLQAPNIQSIQVTPFMGKHLGDQHHQACAARGVCLTTGYVHPGIAASWKRRKEPRKSDWYLLRVAIHAFTSQQRKRFNELLALKFEEAQLLSRYLCLNEEEYVSQRVIAQEFGYLPKSERLVSAKIRAVIHYINPDFRVRGRTTNITSSIQQRVKQARERLAKAHREKLRVDRIAEQTKALTRQLGLERLPTNLPPERLETFKSIIEASRDGRLHSLQEDHPNNYRAIALRFGLEGGKYQTLREVSVSMGVTRARVQQHEVKAFELLGVQ